MKIWFDVDGVLADFTSNLNSLANSIWPNKLPWGYIPNDWEYTGVFTKDDWDTIWRKIKITPDFWYRAQPLMSVPILWEWLAETEHEIFFITSRMATGGIDSKAQTQLWLHRYGLYDKLPTVIAVSRPEEKEDAIRRYEIDLGIDDYAPTVAALNKIADHKCYLLSQPWNADATNLDRVNSLQEFLAIVDSVSHWTGR